MYQQPAWPAAVRSEEYASAGRCRSVRRWCSIPADAAQEHAVAPKVRIRCSIVVSISACHAEDPGSIPGGGVFSENRSSRTQATNSTPLPVRWFCLGGVLLPAAERLQRQKKFSTLPDLCVSSLRRGHANLLCIVPILTDDPRRESNSMARWMMNPCRYCDQPDDLNRVLVAVPQHTKAKAEKAPSRRLPRPAEKKHNGIIAAVPLHAIAFTRLCRFRLQEELATPRSFVHGRFPSLTTQTLNRAAFALQAKAKSWIAFSRRCLLTLMGKADSTLRASRAVPHPSTDRALCRLTSEVRRGHGMAVSERNAPTDRARADCPV